MLASLPRSAWWLVAAALLVAWFSGIALRKLQHPDEGRYAEIAREMAASGDWVTPRLNGLKYFEKPPFQYWATAAAFNTFGVHEWSARLVPALAGLLAVAIVGMTAARLDGPATGVYAALVLAASFWHFAMSQLVTLDSVLGAWLAAALCAFLLAQRDGLAPAVRRNWMLAAYAAAAGATLTKGLVALVIPGGDAGAVHAGDARHRSLEAPARRARPGPVPAFDSAVVPARVARQSGVRAVLLHPRAFPALPDDGTSTRGQLVLLRAAVRGGNPALATRLAVDTHAQLAQRADRRQRLFWPRFCLVWALFVFVFFSFSGSKLPSYILPMFPALALVLGWQLKQLPARTLALLVLPLALLSMVLLAGLGVVLGGVRSGPCGRQHAGGGIPRVRSVDRHGGRGDGGERRRRVPAASPRWRVCEDRWASS